MPGSTTPLSAVPPAINVTGPTPIEAHDSNSLLNARERRAGRGRTSRYNTKSDNAQWPSYGAGPDIVVDQADTPTSSIAPSPAVASPIIPDTPIPGAHIVDPHIADMIHPPKRAASVASSASSSASSSRRSSRIYTPSAGKTYEDRINNGKPGLPNLSVTVPFRQAKFGPPLKVNPQSPQVTESHVSRRIDPPPAYDAGSYVGHYAAKTDNTQAEKGRSATVAVNPSAESPWNPLSTAVSLRSEPLDTPNANALLNEKYNLANPLQKRKGCCGRPETSKRRVIVSILLAVFVLLILGAIGYGVAEQIKKSDDNNPYIPDHYDDESTAGWIVVPTDAKFVPTRPARLRRRWI